MEEGSIRLDAQCRRGAGYLQLLCHSDASSNGGRYSGGQRAALSSDNTCELDGARRRKNAV